MAAFLAFFRGGGGRGTCIATDVDGSPSDVDDEAGYPTYSGADFAAAYVASSLLFLVAAGLLDDDGAGKES